VLKVKLAMSIVGISSIHLLRTFIDADKYTEKTLLWQTVIHMTFVVSAVALAVIDRLSNPKHGGPDELSGALPEPARVPV
jgi:uncharacterized protein (TIGR00645 family)